ncbi:response regulator [Jiulongibacter sediminis]|uniref:response regulator n=1 Tax=Jiulongibacter sediminis TaxID=1605367 RepID=UPI0026EBA3B0|nr:response regulator [Jiulongibacter sediminis]
MQEYKILIAEDDEDDQFLMESAFEDLGESYTYEFVKDGELLKKKLENEKLPSILMMDLNMPKIDGREMLKYIKSSKNMQHLPVLIISTSAAEPEIKNAYAMGAAAYFVKPSNFDDLVKMLKNITGFYFEAAKLSDDNS